MGSAVVIMKGLSAETRSLSMRMSWRKEAVKDSESRAQSRTKFELCRDQAIFNDSQRYKKSRQALKKPDRCLLLRDGPGKACRAGAGSHRGFNPGNLLSMNDLCRLLKYLSRYKGHVAGNIVLNLCYVLTSFFSLTLVAPFVSVLFGLVEKVTYLPDFRLDPDVLMQYAYYYIGKFQADHGMMSGLLLVSLVFVGATVISNTFRYFALYHLAIVRSGILRDLRQDFYAHMMFLPLGYFSEKKKGDMLSRVNMDIPDVEWAVVSSLQGIIMEPLYVIAFAVGLFALDYKLTLLVLVAFPVILYIIGKVGSRLKVRSEKVQRMLGQMVSMVEESINGLRVIKSFNLIDFVDKNFASYNERYVKYLNGVYRRRDLSGPLTEILLVAVTMGVLGFGGTRVLSGQISPDLFVLYILLLIRIISPSKHVVNSFYNIQKGRAALQRIQQVLDEPRGEKEPEGASYSWNSRYGRNAEAGRKSIVQTHGAASGGQILRTLGWSKSGTETGG